MAWHRDTAPPRTETPPSSNTAPDAAAHSMHSVRTLHALIFTLPPSPPHLHSHHSHPTPKGMATRKRSTLAHDLKVVHEVQGLVRGRQAAARHLEREKRAGLLRTHMARRRLRRQKKLVLQVQAKARGIP